MARTKKTETVPPRPKHWSEVKHGCCSCRFYKDDVRNYPCRPCQNWSHWEDAAPDQRQPVPAAAANISAAVSDISETAEPVLVQETHTRAKTARNPRKTAPDPETPVQSPDTSAVPKKRPGRSKKTAPIAEDPVCNLDTSAAVPSKKAKRPHKNSDLTPDPRTSNETDQLSFGL